MKNIILSYFLILSLLFNFSAYSQDNTNDIVESIQRGKENCFPSYIKLKDTQEIEFSSWKVWLKSYLSLANNIDFIAKNVEKDNLGNLNHRFIQTINGIPIYDAVYIVHEKNNKVYAFNGKLVKGLKTDFNSQITSGEAFQKAIKYTNAKVYQWQDRKEEAILKEISGNPKATFYPVPELVLVPKNGDFQSQDYRLAYKFDIFAKQPMSRKWIFIDAGNSEVLFTLNRIQAENESIKSDVTGTAMTKYSGSQTIIADDSIPGNFRLREKTRGNGIETYNMLQGTDYNNSVDFFDSDNIWNNINPQFDEVGADAHWASEMTYDYYFNNFGRNSIDDNGFKLVSYVHYDTSFVNAFWNGVSMTYGDGDGINYLPLTTVDICAHEITHGLTENTAGLIYSNESGALNEGFSDIFGIAVEFFAKPSLANWQMGDDMGPPFRDLSDPIPYGCPNTYLGPNWDNVWQEVHTNSGVLNYWYYLLSVGGNGVNGIGNSYNVSSIGMSKASAISFRLLTVYLVPSSDYAEARNYSILAAIDLYGGCSPEVIAVTNAWYAVGVGAAYTGSISCSFISGQNEFCSVPAIVDFHNTSTNSNSFLWDFGDGTTSTNINPSHTYTSLGLYNVKLVAYATGSCVGSDSLTIPSYVNIDSNLPCVILMPSSGTGAVQTSCIGVLYDSGGTSNYSDNTYSVITIAPADSTGITLTFNSFSFELNWDYLKIYDGPSITSPLIGAYTGNSLPNGGVITASGNSITLEQISDVYITESGFELNWACNPVGINNLNFINNSFQIIPNPTNGNFLLSVNENSDKISLEVFDILGNLVFNSNYFLVDNKFNQNFDFSTFSKGVYVLKVTTSDKIVTKRLIID